MTRGDGLTAAPRDWRRRSGIFKVGDALSESEPPEDFGVVLLVAAPLALAGPLAGVGEHPPDRGLFKLTLALPVGVNGVSWDSAVMTAKLLGGDKSR